MTKYVGDTQINFDITFTTMTVHLHSRIRHAALNPATRQAPGIQEWTYILSYSPADGSKVNGVSVKDIAWTPELTAFVKSLTGGVSFAKIYEAARKTAKESYRPRRKTDHGPYEL